jgi:hypothetical protein
MITFEPFPKIARLSREIVVTEKLDGTNAQVIITEDGEIGAASRSRLIYPGKEDNYGFAGWVERNKAELLKLGPGRHFGEWWGQGIQRGYNQTTKRFSLFNVNRWGGDDRPACCDVVPTIYVGAFSTDAIDTALAYLADVGSLAAPGFTKPEGVVVYHTASGFLFKKTLDNDAQPKGVIK